MKIFNLFPLTVLQNKITLEDDERNILINEIKKMRDEFDKTGELPPHLKKIVKGKKEFEKKFKVKDIEIPGLEWMSKLGEAADLVVAELRQLRG